MTKVTGEFGQSHIKGCQLDINDINKWKDDIMTNKDNRKIRMKARRSVFLYLIIGWLSVLGLYIWLA